MDLMRYGLLAWSVPQRQWPELARSIACNRSGGLAAAEQTRIERIVGERLTENAKRDIQPRRLDNLTEESFQFRRDLPRGGVPPANLQQGYRKRNRAKDS